MQPLKTITFSEGENGTTDNVAVMGLRGLLATPFFARRQKTDSLINYVQRPTAGGRKCSAGEKCSAYVQTRQP